MPYQKAEVVARRFIEEGLVSPESAHWLLSALEKLQIPDTQLLLMVPVAVAPPEDESKKLHPNQERQGDLKDAMAKGYAHELITKEEYTALLQFVMEVNRQMIRHSLDE